MLPENPCGKHHLTQNIEFLKLIVATFSLPDMKIHNFPDMKNTIYTPMYPLWSNSSEQPFSTPTFSQATSQINQAPILLNVTNSCQSPMLQNCKAISGNVTTDTNDEPDMSQV